MKAVSTFEVGDVVRVVGRGFDEFVLLTHESSHGNFAARSCGGYLGSVNRAALVKVGHRALLPHEAELSATLLVRWSRKAAGPTLW